MRQQCLLPRQSFLASSPKTSESDPYKRKKKHKEFPLPIQWPVVTIKMGLDVLIPNLAWRWFRRLDKIVAGLAITTAQWFPSGRQYRCSWEFLPSKLAVSTHVATFEQILLGRFRQRSLRPMAKKLSISLVCDAALRQPSHCSSTAPPPLFLFPSSVTVSIGLFHPQHMSYSDFRLLQISPAVATASNSQVLPHSQMAADCMQFY